MRTILIAMLALAATAQAWTLSGTAYCDDAKRGTWAQVYIVGLEDSSGVGFIGACGPYRTEVTNACPCTGHRGKCRAHAVITDMGAELACEVD